MHVGPLEAEFLDIIWTEGQATSPERGILKADPQPGARVFTTIITREELGAVMIDRIVDGISRGDIGAVADRLARCDGLSSR